VLAAASETAQNQTWLEYYTTYERCKKVNMNGDVLSYWTASIFFENASAFCTVFSDGKKAVSKLATVQIGFAPAFCVAAPQPQQ
jgi:hypothetical protein